MTGNWIIVFNIVTIAVASALVMLYPALRRPVPSMFVGFGTAAAVYLSRIPMLLFWCALCYGLAACIKKLLPETKQASAVRWKWSVASIGLVTGGFLVAGFLGTLRHLSSDRIFLLLPDMWLLLRMVSFLWEYGAGKVQLDPLAYARWMFLPFTLQGPLLRYSEFCSQSRRQSSAPPRFSPKLMMLGSMQLAAGMAIYQVTPVLLAQHRLWASLLVALGTAPWSFYLFAAGMFHVMEALAVTWGINLPKSFDRPFGKSNLSKFWSSWNLTVTNFFRDALFYQRWGLRKPSVYFNLMLLFLAVGLWHGTNLYWSLWGLLHGLGFTLYLLYRSGRLPRIQVAGWERISAFGSAAITYLFVCGCWYLPNKLMLLAQR